MQMIMARPAESSGPANGHSVARVVGLPGSGPTVPRRLLGAQLRRLREERGITLEDAGEVIRASGSKMSRLETGRVGFKDRDIADLLTFYEVSDEQQRAALHQLARLVARLLRRDARVVRVLRRPGGGRGQHPDV